MAQGFEIVVSLDRMQVRLQVREGAAARAGDVIAALGGMKIVGIDEAAINKLLERPNAEAIDQVVVTGAAGVEEKPARIDFRVPMADGQTSLLARIEADQSIGLVVPSAPGSDGKNVFGEVVPHKKNAIEIGRNVKAIKNELTSTARGNLRFQNGKVSVEPLLEIGDKEPRPPAKCEGDVSVRGSLLEGTTMHITGALSVAGAIEGMQLTVDGPAHAKGGVIGKNKGVYLIGGDLKCRFISAAKVRARGNIEVQSEMVNSRIDCLGTLKVLNGPICGGEISANGGIECKTLGNAGGTPTVVEAGPGSAAKHFIEDSEKQIELNRHRYTLVRSKIDPLMKILKQLTPHQRERVTELLSEADDLETLTDEMTLTLESFRKSLTISGKAEVHVSDVLHAGVLVRLGDLETVIPSALKGPLCVMRRKVGGVTEIVLVESDTGNSSTLPTRSQMRAAA